MENDILSGLGMTILITKKVIKAKLKSRSTTVFTSVKVYNKMQVYFFLLVSIVFSLSQFQIAVQSISEILN